MALPGAGALVAAAASISKARCEVDAEAATEAATQLASPGNSFGDKSRNPVAATRELIALTVRNVLRMAKGEMREAQQNPLSLFERIWCALPLRHVPRLATRTLAVRARPPQHDRT